MKFSTEVDSRFLRFIHFFKVYKYTSIVPVDFAQPWRRIIQQQWQLTLFIWTYNVLVQTYMALFPFLIGRSFASESYLPIGGVGALAIFFASSEYLTSRATTELQLRCIHSVFYNAHLQLLKIDPVYHATRASGQVIAKIERGARGIEEILDMISDDFIPTIARTTTILIALLSYSWRLGITMSLAWFGMALLSIYIYSRIVNMSSTTRFRAEDRQRSLGNQNLNQHNFIRSCFASPQVAEELKEACNEAMWIEGSQWRFFHLTRVILNTLYSTVFGLFALYIMYMIRLGQITVIDATALLLAYIGATYDLPRVGRKVYKFLISKSAVNDLYHFIANFGQATIPTINHEQRLQLDRASITLVVDNLHFAHPGQASLFTGQSLSLTVNSHTTNKLFGIIGPSGVGKTTFLSILAGLQRPERGNIYINGIDVFSVGDTTRRQLIGLQQQTASSLLGKLRTTLTFGLPKGYMPSDAELVKLLEDVGLWHLFELKEGLNTFIGEGGLNLSGGQRQRLNFANLYLRARCHRPLLILIDEPTSSLDQVSEQTITAMINELAKSALVFVIAHRIETLENAAACIDFSLIHNQQQIKLYTFDELQVKSDYFKKLQTQHLIPAE